MTPSIQEIVIELDILAPHAQVWEKMLNELPSWWPADFVGLSGGKMYFEPNAGGRLYEENDEGGHLLWSTVAMIVPGSHIDLVGPVTPAFGGPNLNFIRMSIEAAGETTKFRLTNSILGHFDGHDRVTMGWNYLFGSLKSYCEIA
jgi:uncharacterized protein YndB with AHSA1/START domain